MGLLRKPVAHRLPVALLAIFSLHHSVIGKATQERVNTASAHIRYITRDSACTRTEAAHLPEKPAMLIRWFDTQELHDRKNARVCDKLMLALPRELSAEQRTSLVRDFAEKVSRGRVPWFAAFHEQGKDANNPHCHLVIRDRDAATSKRVMLTTERGSTERLREAWESACNLHLERAQQQERVSRLSLKERGLTRTPTIHEGVRARQLAARRVPVRSRAINARNAVTARSKARQIDYPNLDAGTLRVARNTQIRAANERDYWAAIDADAAQRQRQSMPLPFALPNVATASAANVGATGGSFPGCSYKAAAWLEQRRAVRQLPEQLAPATTQGKSAKDLWLERRAGKRLKLERDLDPDEES